ncbi:predicted protein [Nematostella vectensis]|uniref:NudC domain-containing protein 2 n=1 Tax=Nematostella vectensis TaxID=45351 RepID=A7T749_NEMVE|nr:predicted protein [Nematostella vectensis]|eukprot:XP_001620304.1 hypothetical protein NEMVEDRAFT_v1g223245 [Nematostella vectensis]
MADHFDERSGVVPCKTSWGSWAQTIDEIFIEDKKLLRIVLVKSGRDAANCWKSLLADQYLADPWVFNEMEKKLTLERFQKENPGFDFSGAEVTGNYSGGGPKFPSYS